MTILQKLNKQFAITESEILRIGNACKKEALDYGKSDREAFSIDDKDFYLLDSITDFFWYQEKPLDEKIKTGFELYELFPRYFQFLMPYYRLIKNPEYFNLTEVEVKNYSAYKENIWEKFIYYLGNESYYADPVGYVLWVEFFEDSETVNETWEGLIQFTSNKNAVKKLLEMSGPAPFDLKENLYKKIIGDQDYHESIFKSLLFSSFDLFGKIEKLKAMVILNQLELPSDIPHLEKLRNELLK